MKSTWLLALETSVTQATLALARDGEMVASRSFESERSQECDLFPPLADLLRELPEGNHLSTVIAGTGPGSYNGARVGIAAAQAIAQSHGCPVVGLCSFEGTREALRHPTVWGLGDARRGSYFILPLVNGRTQLPPKLMDEPEFLEVVSALDGPRITFESPARLPDGVEVIESHSTAQGLLESWLRLGEKERETCLQKSPEAFYLRPPHITKSKKTAPTGSK